MEDAMHQVKWWNDDAEERILFFETFDRDGKPIVYSEMVDALREIMQFVDGKPFDMIYMNSASAPIVDPRLMGISLSFFRNPLLGEFVITGNVQGVGWLMAIIQQLAKHFWKTPTANEAADLIRSLNSVNH
jgi:hypothetical protein